MSQSPPKPIRIGKYLDAVYPSYALLAGLQLDVFSQMKDGAKSVEEIASILNVDSEQLSVLLYALAAAELLTVDNGKFANTNESAFYLVKNSPAYFGDIHLVVSEMWGALPHTAETIRSGSPQAYIDYHKAEVPEDKRAAYAGLHKLSYLSARDLMQQFDLSAHKHIADIGGGTGALSIALTSKFPELEATIIDLPAATAEAQGYLEKIPQKDRIHLVAQDMVANPIKQKFDGAVMRAFTQVLSPEQNQSALQHTFDALEASGTLYIIARVMDDNHVSPAQTALFNLVFLNVYEGGRAFPERNYRAWLTDAGFINIERFQQPRGDSIIRAKKPS